MPDPAEFYVEFKVPREFAEELHSAGLSNFYANGVSEYMKKRTKIRTYYLTDEATQKVIDYIGFLMKDEKSV